MHPEIHVRRYGTPGAPALVLVHGLSDDGSNWPDAVARWEADWDIYAVDQRGHGLSARFTADTVGRSNELWVNDLRDVLAQVGAPAVVMGHSLGGIVVLRLALMAPQLVRALVLEDPARPSPTGEVDQEFVSQMYTFLAAFPDQAESEMQRMRAETPWSETEIQAWAASKARVDPVMIDGGLVLGDPTWEPLFQALAVPTLLVLPEDGGMGPDKSLYSNPRVERAVIAGAGHCVRRDQPERFHEVVDAFLARHREKAIQSTAPIIDERDEQPYMGVRTLVAMQELGTVIPALLDEVGQWLARQGVEALGAPLVRYHAIDMGTELDITVGIPVTQAAEGDGRIVAESLPAGRYAALTYTGVDNGVQGNGALIEWIASRGLSLDCRNENGRDLFSGRVEFLIDGPDDHPDPSQWRTEVAIRLA